MKVLDLFSCVGNHARGLDRVGGFETVAFVEYNPWRRERLAESFPGVPIHDDVRSYEGEPHDVLFGGPPCQQTSVAAAIHGKRTGASLWPEMRRIAERWRPDFVVVEQPPGNKAWEAQVARDLSGLGYHCARLEFGANDVGALYLRRRVYLLACPSLSRLEIAWAAGPSSVDRVARATAARGTWDPDTVPAFHVDTWRDEDPRERREWIEALGDSNPPEMAEVIGHVLRAAA